MACNECARACAEQQAEMRYALVYVMAVHVLAESGRVHWMVWACVSEFARYASGKVMHVVPSLQALQAGCDV